MGANIQRYRIQWKSGAQDFSDAREMTVARTETDATVPDLMNGREYTIRGPRGSGCWERGLVRRGYGNPRRGAGPGDRPNVRGRHGNRADADVAGTR